VQSSSSPVIVYLPRQSPRKPNPCQSRCLLCEWIACSLQPGVLKAYWLWISSAMNCCAIFWMGPAPYVTSVTTIFALRTRITPHDMRIRQWIVHFRRTEMVAPWGCFSMASALSRKPPDALFEDRTYSNKHGHRNFGSVSCVYLIHVFV
jgi:hypothetical protein